MDILSSSFSSGGYEGDLNKEGDTSFRFRGYPNRRIPSASMLFDDIDEDFEDGSITGPSKPVKRDKYFAITDENQREKDNWLLNYDNPADLCKLTDMEEISSTAESSEAESIPDLDSLQISQDDTGGCLDVPDAAFSSCVCRT